MLPVTSEEYLCRSTQLLFDLIEMGSLEFSKQLLADAKVAVSPGIGFGEYGEGYVRFSLIENEHRTRQAIRGIKQFLSKNKNIHAIG